MYFFHPAAEIEHLEIIAYYETKSPGLGAQYLVEFEGYMEKICESPDMPLKLSGTDLHQQVMFKFPFTILYREAFRSVQVLGVAHQRRRPNYWLGRL